MDTRLLVFNSSHPGFLRNIYFCKANARYYCLQWDNGYSKPPILYTCTRSLEPECPVKKELYEAFLFPEGHEHYGFMLKQL